LNLLTAEAIAAALVLDATITVTTHSALLATRAAQVGVHVDVVDGRT
jgi:diphthamide biosynthesis methyltransferase